jgi:hypothetical protein
MAPGWRRVPRPSRSGATSYQLRTSDTTVTFGGQPSALGCVIPAPDGRTVIVLRRFNGGVEPTRGWLVRVDASLQPDPTLGSGGCVEMKNTAVADLGGACSGMIVKPDNTIFVPVYNGTSLTVWRFNPVGTRDPSFQPCPADGVRPVKSQFVAFAESNGRRSSPARVADRRLKMAIQYAHDVASRPWSMNSRC